MAPHARLCTDSFGAFLHRLWVENEIAFASYQGRLHWPELVGYAAHSRHAIG